MQLIKGACFLLDSERVKAQTEGNLARQLARTRVGGWNTMTAIAVIPKERQNQD